MGNQQCLEHTGTIESIKGVVSRVNLLLALTGGLGSVAIGVLLSIYASLQTVAVDVATLNNTAKVLEARVNSNEQRVAVLEKSVNDLDSMNRLISLRGTVHSNRTTDKSTETVR